MFTDVCEQGNEKIISVFLDLEKAFDKISRNKMFLSLERLNIPSDLLNAIKAIYNNPTFQVTHKDKFSTWLHTTRLTFKPIPFHLDYARFVS